MCVGQVPVVISAAGECINQPVKVRARSRGNPWPRTSVTLSQCERCWVDRVLIGCDSAALSARVGVPPSLLPAPLQFLFRVWNLVQEQA